MKDNIFKDTELFEAYIHFYHLEDKYVILKEDDEGTYIEYAFKEGAPHDNRCLSWYYSFQPNAWKRNQLAFGHTEEEADQFVKAASERVKTQIGKIYELESFTCGEEENPEQFIEERKKRWMEFHPDEPFVEEIHICKVGHPAKKCIENKMCAHWTYKEPVKCACWNLSQCDFKFVIPSRDLMKFYEYLNRNSI
jgi:hypothetical protein